MSATTQRRIPAASVSVLAALVDLAGSGETVQIGQKLLAEKAGITPRWMTQHAIRLEDAGLIEVVPGRLDNRGIPPTTYKVLPAGKEVIAKQRAQSQ